DGKIGERRKRRALVRRHGRLPRLAHETILVGVPSGDLIRVRRGRVGTGGHEQQHGRQPYSHRDTVLMAGSDDTSHPPPSALINSTLADRRRESSESAVRSLLSAALCA